MNADNLRGSGRRILFAGDVDGDSGALSETHRLCRALVSIGVRPLLCHRWHGGGRVRAARIKDEPYRVYGSANLPADLALLGLLEEPELAITFGSDPIALAAPLLDAGVACIAWFIGDEAGIAAGQHSVIDRRLGLAAAGSASSAQLAVLFGRPVATLLPPLAGARRYAAGGGVILVPSAKRLDGFELVLAIAQARPQYRFLVAAGDDHDHDATELSARAALLGNLGASLARDGQRRMRLLLLPTIAGPLPWSLLAECLGEGIPVLASSQPLLVDTVGDAGATLPVSAGLDAWLDRLDTLMNDDAERDRAADRARQRSESLRLPPATAAQRCLELVEAHLDGCAGISFGRI